MIVLSKVQLPGIMLAELRLMRNFARPLPLEKTRLKLKTKFLTGFS